MPQCTICGQETAFIPQYQQWYCYRCQVYPYATHTQPSYQSPPQYYAPAYYAPQYYQPPPAYYRPPAAVPSFQAAISKVHASFMMRQSADRTVSMAWVWAIVLLQVVLPVSAIITGVALLAGTESTEIDPGHLLLIILAVLIVSIALAAVYALLTYRLVGRRDSHFRRDNLLMEGMGEYLTAVSASTQTDLNVERWTMNTLHVQGMTQDRSASLWAVLVALLPIIGIIFLIYCMMFLTKDTHQHDERQRAFNRYFEAGMARSGKEFRASGAWQPLPNRDVAAYVILTVLTVGLFLPYWWYVNIEDMNLHMKNQWEFENALVETFKAEA